MSVHQWRVVSRERGETLHLRFGCMSGGYMVTESTRTFNQVPFKLDAHIQGLYKSLKVTRMDPERSPEEMTQLSLEVMERNLPLYGKGEDLWIVHNISRGAYPPSGDPSFSKSPPLPPKKGLT